MSDLRLDFSGLLRDEVGACGDREMVRELPSLHAAWIGETPLSAGFRLWFLETFLGKTEAARVLRGLQAIGAEFRARRREAFARSGIPQPLDRELIEAIEARVLQAMYPSSFEIATGAIHHPADKVSAGLKRLGATEARWRERY